MYFGSVIDEWNHGCTYNICSSWAPCERDGRHKLLRFLSVMRTPPKTKRNKSKYVETRAKDQR